MTCSHIGSGTRITVVSTIRLPYEPAALHIWHKVRHPFQPLHEERTQADCLPMVRWTITLKNDPYEPKKPFTACDDEERLRFMFFLHTGAREKDVSYAST